MSADPLQKELVTPSARDVWESIGGKEETEPPAPPDLKEIDLSARIVAQNPKELKHSEEILSLAFAPASADIGKNAKSFLSKKALNILRKSPTLRIEIQALATPSAAGHSSARRLSLSRALAVRSYLIEKDVDPARIDIRALGKQSNIKPLDRVDLIFIEKGKML